MSNWNRKVKGQVKGHNQRSNPKVEYRGSNPKDKGSPSRFDE